jgi:hypothetical protein
MALVLGILPRQIPGQEMVVDPGEFPSDSEKHDVAIITEPDTAAVATDDAAMADDEPTITMADDCA